jgi:mono/diheme cytochrome c family protein
MSLAVVIIAVLALTSSSIQVRNHRLVANIFAGVASCFVAVDSSLAVDLNNGAKIFQQSCEGCHAGGGNIIPFSGGKTLFQSALESNGFKVKPSVGLL